MDNRVYDSILTMGDIDVSVNDRLPQPLTRRSFLQVGLATMGLLVTSTGLAELCHQLATPRQTRGPYFPYDDVVSFAIRERKDASLPLIDANDDDLTVVKGKSGKAQGQIIHFHGQLLTGRKAEGSDAPTCKPLKGATVLLWQANYLWAVQSQTGRYRPARVSSSPNRETDYASSR